ncbi:MAG: ATP-grasp fold amidoligase family protein [Devosia sp.]
MIFPNPVEWLLVLHAYRVRVGRFPNLLRPRTFGEKMQVAKLTWRTPMMPLLADKVRVKDIVAGRLGAEWVTPTLFAGASLPPREDRVWPLPYVIKANNSSGANIFVRTEDDINWERIEQSVQSWMSRRNERLGEWAYKDIPPQVLVEPLAGGSTPKLEYKLFCFGGRVEFIEVHLRHKGGRRECANMDRDWVQHPFTLKIPMPKDPPPRPVSLDEMIRGAERLAEGFPFVRIDLYEVDGRPRFGEVTFYPASGFINPSPPEYDRTYGDLWPPGMPTGKAAGL